MRNIAKFMPVITIKDFAPGSHCKQSPQTPNKGSHSALAMNSASPLAIPGSAPDCQVPMYHAQLLLGAEDNCSKKALNNLIIFLKCWNLMAKCCVLSVKPEELGANSSGSQHSQIRDDSHLHDLSAIPNMQSVILFITSCVSSLFQNTGECLTNSPKSICG